VALLGATVVAFGKFDGVHRGHRALLDRALGAGRRIGLPTGAVTFARHPHAYLSGETPPALSGLADRLRLLRDAGAAFVVLLPTDATVLGLAAEDFAREVLRDRMGVRLVVVGGNFRFGRGGAGDVATLRRLVSVTGLDGVKLGMVSVGGRGGVGDPDPRALGTGRRRPGRGPARPAVRRPGRLVSAAARCLIRIAPTLAVPAPRRYRASIEPFRPKDHRTTAVVAVRPSGDGAHCVEVDRPESGLTRVAGGRGARVTFEGRP
jgi:riboflavin kinase/FMN adenylyltransferase